MAVRRRLLPSPVATDAARDAFYAALVPPGGLCFDIGANLGNRLASFRRSGFRVVAVEPQAKCQEALRAAFGRDPAVTLVQKAVGSTPGQATLRVAEQDVLSTLSPAFIEVTTDSGRFKGLAWNGSEEVEMTTLDALVAQFGQPDFIKIDVEGFEQEVMRGLSRAVRLVSLEWIPELTDTTLACIEHLSALGPASYNLSWGESMEMASARWMDKRQIVELLDSYRGDTYYFGDVYVRSEP